MRSSLGNACGTNGVAALPVATMSAPMSPLHPTAAATTMPSPSVAANASAPTVWIGSWCALSPDGGWHSGPVAVSARPLAAMPTPQPQLQAAEPQAASGPLALLQRSRSVGHAAVSSPRAFTTAHGHAASVPRLLSEPVAGGIHGATQRVDGGQGPIDAALLAAQAAVAAAAAGRGPPLLGLQGGARPAPHRELSEPRREVSAAYSAGYSSAGRAASVERELQMLREEVGGLRAELRDVYATLADAEGVHRHARQLSGGYGGGGGAAVRRATPSPVRGDACEFAEPIASPPMPYGASTPLDVTQGNGVAGGLYHQHDQDARAYHPATAYAAPTPLPAHGRAMSARSSGSVASCPASAAGSLRRMPDGNLVRGNVPGGPFAQTRQSSTRSRSNGASSAQMGSGAASTNGSGGSPPRRPMAALGTPCAAALSGGGWGQGSIPELPFAAEAAFSPGRAPMTANSRHSSRQPSRPDSRHSSPVVMEARDCRSPYASKCSLGGSRSAYEDFAAGGAGCSLVGTNSEVPSESFPPSPRDRKFGGVSPYIVGVDEDAPLDLSPSASPSSSMKPSSSRTRDRERRWSQLHPPVREAAHGRPAAWHKPGEWTLEPGEWSPARPSRASQASSSQASVRDIRRLDRGR
eukprot:TRINITY_DN11457_c1_g1_i1.p1 TRINITY_DN11457_c1_g1~~TRINITY_DN11457_c1_g1_i1.p1  ORF type:complete len:670 (-),score=60.81 TRINITY_DN11457_c1_g1_i1:150-2060(-)